MAASALSPADLDLFMRRGFVKIPGALDRELARRWVDASWARIGYDPRDVSTWTEARVHFPRTELVDPRAVAPRAWAAMCQLVGGEERIVSPTSWGNGFIANYGIGADAPWVAASAEAGGWHKDGDTFIHFLDSPQQALLTIVLWDDVAHRGGPTYLACDSVPQVARYLAAHPEGINPMGRGMPELGPGFPHQEFVSRCSDFVEATGERGDVFLMHPFMLHAPSSNAVRRARFITNPPISFRAPMRFDRERAADHSPVERAVLKRARRRAPDLRADHAATRHRAAARRPAASAPRGRAAPRGPAGGLRPHARKSPLGAILRASTRWACAQR